VLLVRLAEQQIMKEYFQDEMKTPVHLAIGAEAIAAGVHFACPEDTEYFGTYRNHAIFLNCSMDTDGFFGEMYGKVNGCGKGKAGSMHMSCPEDGLIATSAVVATTIPVAAGAALSAQYQGSNKMACVIFGDGAVEEGVFFETLNFASLKKLPLLFVCEDNELAIHSAKHERKGFHSYKDLAKLYDLEFAEGDGTDVTDVALKTRDVVARMKKSGKPGLVHYNWFRFLEHVGPLEDFDKGYRKKPDDMAAKWDPLPKIHAAALKGGVSAEKLKKIETDFLKQIEISVAKAKAASFPPPAELFTDVFVGGGR
jgi:pyruvate dehydrogenase E1 component alpha subunit